MRTLKESILDDIDIQVNNGKEFVKTYKKAEKELNDIKKHCSDLSKWSVYTRDIAVQYTIFIQCSKLSKHFDLDGKNLLIGLTYYPKNTKWTGWCVNYKLTNCRWPNYSETPWGQEHLYVKNWNKAIEYRHEEIGNSSSNDSKYTLEQIIEKLILSKFENMEVFKSEIVDMYKTLEKENANFKYIDVLNL